MKKIYNVESIIQKIDEIIGNEISFQDNISRIENDLIKLNNSSNIKTNWVITSHRKFLGKFIIFIKKIIRKILKWYMNGIIDQQNEYNTINTRINLSYKALFQTIIEQEQKKTEEINQILELVGNLNLSYKEIEKKFSIIKEKEELKKETEELKKEIEDLKRYYENDRSEFKVLKSEINSLALELLNLKKLEGKQKDVDNKTQLINDTINFINSRIRRIERKLKNSKSTHLSYDFTKTDDTKKESLDLELDYFLFEHKFRGSVEYIKQIQSRYLDIFKNSDSVLDIGCGRGEFVELLLENNIKAKGIDINDDFINYCLENNLPVENEDMFLYLEKCEDNSIGGVFCSQVVEHLTPQDMIYFIKLVYKKLKNNAPLVIETINPKNIVAVSNWFYMDLTHVRPVHPDTLKFISEQEGFNVKDIMYTEPDSQNQIPALEIKNIEESNIEEFNSKIKFINEVLSGPQNYSLIAKKISL